MGQLGELPLADLTPVGLDAEVDSHVLGEVGAVGERFTAVAAFVGFGLSHVDLSVELQVGFRSKSLKKKLLWSWYWLDWKLLKLVFDLIYIRTRETKKLINGIKAYEVPEDMRGGLWDWKVKTGVAAQAASQTNMIYECGVEN